MVWIPGALATLLLFAAVPVWAEDVVPSTRPAAGAVDLPAVLGAALVLSGLVLMGYGAQRARNGVSAVTTVTIGVAVTIVANLVSHWIRWRHDEWTDIRSAAVLLSGVVAVIVLSSAAERLTIVSTVLIGGLLGGVLAPYGGPWGSAVGLARSLHPLAGLFLVAGGASLGATVAVGARIGKYRPDGSPNAMPGHFLPAVGLGGLWTWLGIAVLCPVLASAGGRTPDALALNVLLGGALGCLSAALMVRLWFGSYDPVMVANGVLAGAVASAIATETPWLPALASVIAALAAVAAATWCERHGVDDVTAGSAVFGVGGLTGALAFAAYAGAWKTAAHAASVWLASVATAWLLMRLLAAIGQARVSPEVEMRGLDSSVHAGSAYPDFVVHTGGHLR